MTARLELRGQPPRTWDLKTSPISIPAAPKRPGPTAPFDRGWSTARGAATNDGRSGHALGATVWRVRWRAPLSRAFDARAVLVAGSRVLVEQDGAWELFDLEGTSLAHERAGAGQAELDHEGGVFRVVETTGHVATRALEDGARRWALLPRHGDKMRRELATRDAADLVFVGVEVARDPHGEAAPTRVVAQRMSLGSPMRLTGAGLVLSAADEAVLTLEGLPAAAAASGGAVVLAMPDLLVFLDRTFEPRAFRDRLVPRGVALDAAGRAVVVGRDHAGDEVLWVVTPDGQRVLARTLPRDCVSLGAPLAGWDHSLYVVGADRIVCLGADGAARWDRVPAARPGGAAISANGLLLVSEGDRVMAYGGGRDERLVVLPGERLTTPPALADPRTLLVAGPRVVYCLEPAP